MASREAAAASREAAASRPSTESRVRKAMQRATTTSA
jgi:hypothetical protein